MAEEKAKAADKRLAIIKIYLKDFSFESPLSPSVFRADEWKPQMNLNLRSVHAKVDNDYHEVILTITIEAKDKESDKTLFLVELHQAGLFEISGYSGEELAALTGSFCPNILFPYAREAVASAIQRGGFPEFVLQPINFDALFMQQVQAQKLEAEKQAAAQAEKH
ncbi:MAG TPA: protein-export chaperone SecB [Woeseiaceae bacterium]|nr:protein-export chaperone SecB [Woeseiaceae bacterium]